jgi:hypothetical protein
VDHNQNLCVSNTPKLSVVDEFAFECRGAVSASGVYRDQSGDKEPGGGALLQQTRHRRGVDQRRQAGSQDDAVELPPLPLQRGAAGAEPAGLQLGEPVAAAGVAQANRELVADQLAAAVGEDRRASGEARPVLLAAVGGEPSDAAAL